MGVRKILVTSNDTDDISSPGGGICRTMVLTWISESLKGVRMMDMATHLVARKAIISAKHKALKIRMGKARTLDGGNPVATASDFTASFNLQAGEEAMQLPTALVGVTLDPGQLTTDTSYVMITLEGIGRAHAVGMALNISGRHYFLDPNSGLYECDALTDIAGALGLVARHLISNYIQNYPNAMIEEFSASG